MFTFVFSDYWHPGHPSTKSSYNGTSNLFYFTVRDKIQTLIPVISSYQPDDNNGQGSVDVTIYKVDEMVLPEQLESFRDKYVNESNILGLYPNVSLMPTTSLNVWLDKVIVGTIVVTYTPDGMEDTVPADFTYIPSVKVVPVNGVDLANDKDLAIKFIDVLGWDLFNTVFSNYVNRGDYPNKSIVDIIQSLSPQQIATLNNKLENNMGGPNAQNRKSIFMNNSLRSSASGSRGNMGSARSMGSAASVSSSSLPNSVNTTRSFGTGRSMGNPSSSALSRLRSKSRAMWSVGSEVYDNGEDIDFPLGSLRHINGEDVFESEDFNSNLQSASSSSADVEDVSSNMVSRSGLLSRSSGSNSVSHSLKTHNEKVISRRNSRGNLDTEDYTEDALYSKGNLSPSLRTLTQTETVKSPSRSSPLASRSVKKTFTQLESGDVEEDVVRRSSVGKTPSTYKTMRKIVSDDDEEAEEENFQSARSNALPLSSSRSATLSRSSSPPPSVITRSSPRSSSPSRVLGSTPATPTNSKVASRSLPRSASPPPSVITRSVSSTASSSRTASRSASPPPSVITRSVSPRTIASSRLADQDRTARLTSQNFVTPSRNTVVNEQDEDEDEDEDDDFEPPVPQQSFRQLSPSARTSRQLSPRASDVVVPTARTSQNYA